MANSAINNSISAINADMTRLGAVSHNLANVNTTTRLPEAGSDTIDLTLFDVIQQDVEGGGTQAQLKVRDPAGYASYEPESPLANEEGLVQRPNVDIAQEMTGMIQATRDLQMNIKTIQAYDEMLKALLDIKK